MSENEHERLQNIAERLAVLKTQNTSNHAPSSSAGAAVGRLMWIAFNVVSDLIAGVICGLGLGYGLDVWLGTRPVFIAVFLVLGCAAGLLNAVRFLKNFEQRRLEKESRASQKE